MKPTLGGSLFVYNAQSQDYSYIEAIECLIELCDEVVVLDAGSDDGTVAKLKASFWNPGNSKVRLLLLDGSEWRMLRGKEKLAHFTNYAIGSLTTDWNFNLQADECIHENCFDAIRAAIEKPEEAYRVRRINLWGDSEHALSVPHDRSPVGTNIIRLAKTKYRSVDDAEGIYAPASSELYDRDAVRMYHTGFVRNKFLHCRKIEHMQTKVFGMGFDPKVEAMRGVFDPWAIFDKKDVVSISEPLPKFIQSWAALRDEINLIPT